MATDLVSRVTTIVAVVDKATAPMRAIEARFLALGRVASGVTQRFRGLAERSGLNRIPGMLSNIGNRALSAGRSLVNFMAPLLGLGAGGAIVGGLFSIQRALDAFVESGKRLNVEAEKLGLPVERLQDLEHWAMLAEVPAEALDASLGRLNRTLAQVAAGKNKEATKLLGFVGIAARDARGRVRSAADVMPQLANAMARIHNPAQRARLAVALFGKSGQLLIPMLAQGSRALAAATRELDRMGRMTRQEAALADELDDAQQRLRVVLGRVAQIIGSALAPYVLKAVNGLREWIVQNRRWITTRIHYYVDLASTAVERWWKQLRAVKWGDWLAGLEQSWRRVTALVDSLGGVNRLLQIFLGLLVVSKVANFTVALAGLARALRDVGKAAYAALGPWGLLAAAAVAAAVVIYTQWNRIDHYFRYYGKKIDKTTSYYFEVVKRTVSGVLDDLYTSVSRRLDDIAGLWTRAWERLSDNPLVRLLSGLGPGLAGAPVGLGLPPMVLAPTLTPPPPGPGRGAPPPGPYRGGYVFPGNPNGTVDVNVNFQNAPSGTRVDTSTSGAARATSKVGVSMPQTRRGR